MKKLITTFLSISTTVAILALPVAARNLIAQPNNSFQDAACADEAKTALYQSFLKNLKADQAKAYEEAKKYVACPASGEVTDAQQKIIDYLKNFVTKYEAATNKTAYRIKIYNEKKYAEGYAMGKAILATEPDNLQVLVDLGANAYLLPPLKIDSLTAEGLGYAQKALGMLDAGKTLENWDPLGSKDVAVAYLNYSIGTLTLEKDPSGALKNLIKAAQFETPLKKSPQTYAYIGGSYELGPYAKLSDEYTTKYKGQNETPESKLALANINQVVDRMVDAYARAVNLAGSDSKLATQKATWTERLTEWYKYRHNQTTDGMNEMVAGVLSKPLPPEPTPLTSLPAEPATTPIGNSGTTASTTAATQPANGNKPATAKTGTPDKPKNK